MASNLRRSKRTVGKRITDLNERVTRLQKQQTPTSIAQGAVGDTQLGNISASKITTGTLNSIEINAGTPVGSNYPFSVSPLGVVRAVSGTVGGFTLSSAEITASYAYSDATTDITASLELGVDAQVYTRYDYYTGAISSYYTEIYLNKTDEQGGIIVRGDGSGSLQTTKIFSSSVITYDLIETSDKRLKENVNSLTGSLAVIAELEPVSYTFIGDAKSKEHHGFVAQDMQKVYPQAVMVGGDDPEKDPWGVNYSKMTALLTGGIKELVDKVDRLQARVTELENKN